MNETTERNLMQASREWFSRPDDERYLSLEALHAATLARADRSETTVLRHDALEAVGDSNGGQLMRVRVPDYDDEVDPTNWSFGQLCSRARVPASFARGGCHPSIVADAINYNLRFVAPVEESQLMVSRDEHGELELRAITSPSYGRIYDHRVVEAVMAMNDDGRWVVPAGSTYDVTHAANSKRATTLYASDRDVFIFLVDPNTPIEVPRPEGGDPEVLWRGFMVWNSEVGKTTFGVRTFLYRHVCDNRIVWGARDVKKLTIRHTKGGPDRFRREAQPMLEKYATSTAKETADTVRRSMEMTVGNTDDDVAEWLGKRQYSKAQANRIIKSARAEEGEARTVWQLVQGATAQARALTHTDGRVEAETRASRMLDLAK